VGVPGTRGLFHSQWKPLGIPFALFLSTRCRYFLPCFCFSKYYTQQANQNTRRKTRWVGRRTGGSRADRVLAGDRQRRDRDRDRQIYHATGMMSRKEHEVDRLNELGAADEAPICAVIMNAPQTSSLFFLSRWRGVGLRAALVKWGVGGGCNKGHFESLPRSGWDVFASMRHACFECSCPSLATVGTLIR